MSEIVIYEQEGKAVEAFFEGICYDEARPLSQASNNVRQTNQEAA
jgi:hypothetical protein